MDSVSSLPPQVDAALSRGWTVLTANQRAARTLRLTYDRRQLAGRTPGWKPPPIFAWETWTANLWQHLLQEGHASALLLSKTQEHTLWRAVISDAERKAPDTFGSLRPLDSLAELAASAWSSIHAYRGRRRLRAAVDSADTRAFERWASELERRFERSNYLSGAQLHETLRAAAERGHIALGPHVSGLLLVGFDTKTPAQIALLDSLREIGVAIEDARLKIDAADASSLFEASTGQDELAACAAWIRSRIHANRDARLAVIVPDLDAARAEVDRAFRHMLASELEDIVAPAHSGPFEFSLGVPLAQTATVSTALDILRWMVAPLALERVSALLLSPHFAGGSEVQTGEGSTSPHIFAGEYMARAEFDAFVLRRQPMLQAQASIDTVRGLAARSGLRLPALVRHLHLLGGRKDFSTEDRTYADWAAKMHDVLEAAGWARGDDSIEFQTRERWQTALDDLASLDFSGDRVRFEEALRAIERIAAQTLFAPRSRRAPIQIMGPLESAGSTFDGIWFLRAGSLTWPAGASAHPLLPRRLQSELGMPGVDLQHFAQARRITQRIAESAPQIVFSYAEQTPEGSQGPSPILATLEHPPVRAEWRPAQAANSNAIELEGSVEPAIPHPPDRPLAGGAGILQAQAACGFRAFAEKRLFSSTLETRDLGLDAGERGSLVHEVLDIFWGHVETQAALRLLSNEERDDILRDAIRQTLAGHISAVSHRWSVAYLDAEQRRLVELLTPWLEYERDMRSPFVVKAREQKLKNVQIGPLTLDIRVDRVDTHMRDGAPAGEIILDYKTGAAKTADWLGDRPEAPQLPLYAVVSGSTPLDGVAFASVRPGKSAGLSGYEASPGVLPNADPLKAPSLEAQVEAWRDILTSLADAFHSSDASVSPKQYPGTCRYCEQRTLCRLNVSKLEADAMEELTDSDLPQDSAEADRG